MEKTMDNEIKNREIHGVKELNLGYYDGETILITMYTELG